MIHRRALPFLLIFALAACQTPPAPSLYQAWDYADLRLLDTADAELQGLDLLAAYTRRIGAEWQVRLDLLDLDAEPDFDLYLAFDMVPGGAELLPLEGEADIAWDTLIVIPAAGDILVLSSGPDQSMKPRTAAGLRLRVLRDPLLDTLEISFNRAAFSGQDGRLKIGQDPGFKLQVFTTLPGKTAIADSLGPLRSDGTPPAPAQVLYTFWNTMPAYTPAEALRRWDGAHTGPLGGRHGLYNLLRAVRNTSTPVALLDLNQPTFLSALDTVGGLSLVRNLLQRGLLILPQALPGIIPGPQPALMPGWAIARAADDSRQAGLGFGLPASPFLFAPLGLSQVDAANFPASLAFIPDAAQASQLSTARISRWKSLKVVPISGYGDPKGITNQATLVGPTPEVRRALIQAALEVQEGGSRVLVLGGDLPDSTWGDPQIARFTLQYLAAHPWVQALNANDLLSIPASQPALPAPPVDLASSPDLPMPSSSLLADLENAPANNLGRAAWQAYLALFAPAFPEQAELPTLRAAYLGQLGVLLAGARWAEQPQAADTCDSDLDSDGLSECLLASRDLFLAFELHGGSLAYAFSRGPHGEVHQWVGPSSQLTSGLSPASSWDLAAGLLADPDVLPGAFFETALDSDPAPDYQAVIQPGRLELTTTDGSVKKTFILQGASLQVSYQTENLLHTRMVLMLDPWQRFSPDWTDNYQAHTAPDSWTWEANPAQVTARQEGQIPGSLRVEVRTESAWTASTFKDSLPQLEKPENPNLDYPPGHFLPFPLASMEFSIQGDFSANLTLTWEGP
jgi:hypothetical protein